MVGVFAVSDAAGAGVRKDACKTLEAAPALLLHRAGWQQPMKQPLLTE